MFVPVPLGRPWDLRKQKYQNRYKSLAPAHDRIARDNGALRAAA
jgi:hypothetical protein